MVTRVENRRMDGDHQEISRPHQMIAQMVLLEMITQMVVHQETTKEKYDALCWKSSHCVFASSIYRKSPGNHQVREPSVRILTTVIMDYI